MIRKLMLALAVCAFSAVAVSAVAQGAEGDITQLSLPGNYTITVNGQKSTVTIAGCPPAKWGPNTVLNGTPIKLPEIELPAGCDYGTTGWVQGYATGTDWNLTMGTHGQAISDTPISAKGYGEILGLGATDCKIGLINLTLAGKYKATGKNTLVFMLSNKTVRMPYPFIAIPPANNQGNCDAETTNMQIQEALGIVPVTYHMLVTAVKKY